LTLAGAMITLFSLVAPEPLVQLMAVYTVILLGWLLGLFIGLGRRAPDGTRYPIVIYGGSTLLAAFGVTVPIASWLAEQPGFTSFGAQALVFPVACAIPALAPDYPRIFNLARREFVRRFFGRNMDAKP